MARFCIGLFVLAILVSRCSAAAPPVPFGMTWSNKSFGPDGPWQAVEVIIGNPQQAIALYPGGTFRSHLLTSKICSNATLSPNICYASAAGTYSPSNSLSDTGTLINFPAATDFTHGGLQVQGTVGVGALDQVDIGTSFGLRNDVIVPNVTLALNDAVAAVYPGGSISALQVGTLALGYLGTVNQSFSETTGGFINGSLIPGYLQAQSLTPSNSFGLHIGSVEPRIEGSLYFGGYDQNRICGPITTQQGPFAGIEPDDNGKKGLIDLLDIQINVVDGASPWNTSATSNLLAAGNSSIGPSLPVSMLPEAPYFDLPRSTCDAITAWLPVTYQADLGLYTWNTNDAQYTKIVSSASVLSFVFQKNQINTQNITINVPFMLLNLTLSAPLTNQPTQYFPCNAQSYGRYSLGRAFLQAAFIGQNWNTNGNTGVWWLAQAPGPNISPQSNVQAIQDQDSAISSSSNDWAASWTRTWTPLVGQSAASPSPSSSSAASKSLTSGGLSTGAKAGIGAGVSVCTLAITCLAGFLLYRWRHNRKEGLSPTPLWTAGTADSGAPGTTLPNNKNRTSGIGPAELNSHEFTPTYELKADNPQELAG